MSRNDTITLFHSPQTRSSCMLALLEELGAPYELHILNMKMGEQRQPAYLAVNPAGKVPAIRHGDAIITEQVAIAMYLADLFPEAGLAPAIGDPSRGPYLRWLVYYAACFEPAVTDKSLNREPASRSRSPYGDYDEVLEIVTRQLSKAPYLLGDKISAADIVWGMALMWTMMFKVVPETPVFTDYAKRITSRPGFQTAWAIDARLAAEHEAAAARANG